jgi:ABC-type transport system involved in multi-copper enzyme maturation permease subunit
MGSNLWWLFRAEWRKVTGNRWMMCCFVWIWPIAAIGVSLIFLAFALTSEESRQGFADDPEPWTEAALFFWTIPNSIVGRLLIIGLTAIMFGGEYQWGTWKNLMTRRRRVTLILTKFGTVGMFVIMAFGLTSILWVLGIGVVHWTAGAAYPPALVDVPASYWLELCLQILVAFVSTLTLVAIAALAALLTRSSLGALVIGLGAALLDGFIAATLFTFYLLTDIRLFPSLYRFSISYNVDNLLNYINYGGAVPVMNNVRIENNSLLGDISLNPPLAGNPPMISFLLLTAWMVTLVSLAVYTFNKQDLR